MFARHVYLKCDANIVVQPLIFADALSQPLLPYAYQYTPMFVIHR